MRVAQFPSAPLGASRSALPCRVLAPLARSGAVGVAIDVLCVARRAGMRSWVLPVASFRTGLGRETARMTYTPHRIERLYFSSAAPTSLLERMEELAAAADGWINVLPKPDDDRAIRTSLGFLALLGGGASGLTMWTWIPRDQSRRDRLTTRLGISHVKRCRAATIVPPVPLGWRVEQDHPRRGLVLAVPPEEAHAAVATWALRATEALSARPVIAWRADVYLPARPSRAHSS